MMKLLRLIVAALVIISASTAPVSAADEPMLTISGNVSKMATGGVVSLSRADFEAMPKTSFATTTIWTEGKPNFTGVALVDLMDAIGAKGSKLRMTALNDYSIDVPLSDAIVGGPIIAYQIDGMPISVRDKGPLWLVYPYDNNVDYRTETIYSRSIWQLNRLEVIE